MGLRRAVLRRAFNALYGPFASQYDLITSLLFLGEWRRWQMLGLEHTRGTQILEVGPGTGQLMAQASLKGKEIYGIDVSAQMIAVARRRLLSLGLPVRLVRGSAENLPFADSTFDTVLATFPTDYVMRRQCQMEMGRVLKPGGSLAIVMGGELSAPTPLRRLLAWLYRLLTGRLEEPPHPWGLGTGTLEGRWIIEKSARGHALIFVAEKSGQPAASDPPNGCL